MIPQLIQIFHSTYGPDISSLLFLYDFLYFRCILYAKIYKATHLSIFLKSVLSGRLRNMLFSEFINIVSIYMILLYCCVNSLYCCISFQ